MTPEEKKAYYREAARVYRAENSEKYREYQRARYAANREKLIERQRAYRAADPQRQAEARLRRAYGISIGEWQTLFESQGSACGICKAEAPGGKHWHVDHCHDSGSVRGILCVNCNTALGGFKDDREVLACAIAYLEKHGK